VIRVHVFDEQASYAPYTCFQCNEAWCMTACPVNAIALDPATGAKVVMENVCVGCAVCTIACPYGTMFYNPDTHKAIKCDLCGGEPACVNACPTDAIEYTELEQPDWLAAWAQRVNSRFLTMQEGAPR
jgi:Fe-S-cluster-containing hydrogenase component 2